MRHALAAAFLLFAAPAAAQTWVWESEHALPSTDTAWGSAALGPSGTTLFIGRIADGLTAFDTATHAARGVADSKGALGVVLANEVGRGYAPMSDGTVLVFDLNTLAALDRIDTGVPDLADGFYEPSQKRVHFITGGKAEKTTWVTIDAATGQVLGRTEFNSRRMDVPATDGEGAIFAPMRDRGLLHQLDARDLSVQKTWKLGDCAQPSSVQWDRTAERVLIACRGDKPVFAALNPVAGVVATVPIGRGAEGLIVDPARRLIVVANGADATLSVIRQDGPDAYALVETIATRPLARLLSFDEKTGRLFTMAATVTYPAPGPDKQVPPPYVHPGSFTVMTFRRN